MSGRWFDPTTMHGAAVVRAPGSGSSSPGQSLPGNYSRRWRHEQANGALGRGEDFSGLSLRSVGNGLKLRPESRTLRRAPRRRVPTGTPAPVGTGYRLLFV